MKTCNNCNSSKDVAELRDMPPIPFAAHEAEVSRQERQIKRMWIALIVAWTVVLAVVGIFTYERLQYDYTGTYEEIIVDAEDNGNANYIGQDGNIYNGEDNSTKNNEEEN